MGTYPPWGLAEPVTNVTAVASVELTSSGVFVPNCTIKPWVAVVVAQAIVVPVVTQTIGWLVASWPLWPTVSVQGLVQTLLLSW